MNILKVLIDNVIKELESRFNILRGTNLKMNISKTWNPYADIILINGKIYTVAITIDEIKK